MENGRSIDFRSTRKTASRWINGWRDVKLVFEEVEYQVWIIWRVNVKGKRSVGVRDGRVAGRSYWRLAKNDSRGGYTGAGRQGAAGER